MVQLGAEGVQNETDIAGGSDRPEPGRYVVAIHEVKECEPGQHSDKIIIEFRVLGGTVPGQNGRTFSEFFFLSEKALPRLQRLALAIGLLKPGEPPRDITFVHSVDSQLIVEVEHDTYTKDGVEKKSCGLSYMGMWSLNNPEVADVMQAASADVAQQAQAQQNQAAQQPVQQPVQQQPVQQQSPVQPQPGQPGYVDPAYQAGHVNPAYQQPVQQQPVQQQQQTQMPLNQAQQNQVQQPSSQDYGSL